MSRKGNKVHRLDSSPGEQLFLLCNVKSMTDNRYAEEYVHFPVKLKKLGEHFFNHSILRRLFQKVVAPAKRLWGACWMLPVTTQKELVARDAWAHITARWTKRVHFPPSNSLYQQAFLQSLLKRTILPFCRATIISPSHITQSKHTHPLSKQYHI